LAAVYTGDYFTMTEFQEIIDNFIRWGNSSRELYAAFIIGSQARSNHPADEYSDLDIVMLVDNPSYFLSSDQWLKNIAEYHVSFSEDSMAGGKERRILFDGALDVDFILLPNENPENIIKALNCEMASMLERGYKILIDKIKLQEIMPRFDAVVKSDEELTEQDFTNIVNDFWYHSVWAAKKLKRGEIWTAKYCVDTYMKSKLLCIIECHARTIHGKDYDTWHNGRFIEQWAPCWVVERLSLCFAHYRKEDIKIALISTMDLFRAVAVEIAEKLGFQYPHEADKYTAAWVTAALRER